jgi:hypothetical protein
MKKLESASLSIFPGERADSNSMPTARTEPRPLAEKHPYFYKHFERVQIVDVMSVSWILSLLNKMKSVQLPSLFHLHSINHALFKGMAQFMLPLKHQSSLMLSAVMLSSALHEEVLREKS